MSERVSCNVAHALITYGAFPLGSSSVTYTVAVPFLQLPLSFVIATCRLDFSYNSWQSSDWLYSTTRRLYSLVILLYRCSVVVCCDFFSPFHHLLPHLLSKEVILTNAFAGDIKPQPSPWHASIRLYNLILNKLLKHLLQPQFNTQSIDYKLWG